MEIERKYLLDQPPAGYDSHPSRAIEQAYLCTEPVVRVRKEDDSYYLTYKGKGLMAREEYNLPLTREAYLHLLSKADGNVLTKRRYLIPLEGTELTVELDVFSGKFQGLVLAEGVVLEEPEPEEPEPEEPEFLFLTQLLYLVSSSTPLVQPRVPSSLTYMMSSSSWRRSST